MKMKWKCSTTDYETSHICFCKVHRLADAVPDERRPATIDHVETAWLTRRC